MLHGILYRTKFKPTSLYLEIQEIKHSQHKIY